MGFFKVFFDVADEVLSLPIDLACDVVDPLAGGERTLRRLKRVGQKTEDAVDDLLDLKDR